MDANPYFETEHFKAYAKRMAEKYDGLDVRLPTTLNEPMPNRLPMNQNAEDVVVSFRSPYPALPVEVPVADWVEVAHCGLESDNALVLLLASVSDCLYQYEVDNNFHGDDMRMAYLTMKRSVERIGDVKPFLTTIIKNRRARDWAMISLIWCFTLPSNNAYWNDFLNPPEIFAKNPQMKPDMEKFVEFRNEFKRLHEEKKIVGIEIIYSKNCWFVRLFKKKNNETSEDPTA